MLELKKLSEKIPKNLILFLSILLIFLSGENLANPKNAVAETTQQTSFQTEFKIMQQESEIKFAEFLSNFWRDNFYSEYFETTKNKNKKEKIAIFSELVRKKIFPFPPENAEKILKNYPLFCRAESLCKIDKKNFSVYFFEKKPILKIFENKIEYFFYDENGNFEKEKKYF